MKLLFTLLVIVGLIALHTNSVNATTDAIIPDRYIVVLKDNVSDVHSAAAEATRQGASVDQEYSHLLKGYSASIPPRKLKTIANDPRVAFISPDRIVHTMSHPPRDLGRLTPTQSLPTGVSRVGAQNLPNKGMGIGVAVLDTGIDLTHPDLAASIVASKSCTSKRTAADDNGHGTHVAGTIAGINNTQGVVGVAPEAKLIAVKVLSSSGAGTWSSIICGIDWVTANAATYNIKVANMSLGGSGTSDNNCGNTNNDALHKAICRSRDAGITYIVAAGNEGANASNLVPAAYDDAVITISALADSDGQAGGTGAKTAYGPDDTFATFSNYGAVVDLGAPGVAIHSTWKSGGYKTVSGTSMAAPHVAGAAALYIKSNPGSTWTQVRDGLQSMSEGLGLGHTDPSGRHPEPILKAGTL